MKKLLTFAAITIAAGLVQAASINWSVAASTVAKSADDVSGNNRAYGYTVGVFNASDRETVLALLTAGNVSGAMAKAIDTETTGKTGAASGSIEGLSGSSASIFLVTFDTYENPKGSGSFIPLGSAKNYIVGATLTAATYQPPASAAAENTAAYTSSNYGGSWTAIPVPEPCTATLLALGLAAVGLKRKVA